MRWILLITLFLTAPARAAGLLAPSDQTLPPLRVTDHLVDVEVHDRVALTTVTQTFRNDTNRRLEATYVFPLPDNADLTNFQMTFNGKLVEGEVLPADEARQIYESIVRRTKDPGLIEFIGRQLLQMRVFPIEPGSDTTIKLRYQQVTRPISDMQGYHYPLRTRKTAGQAYGMVRFNVSLKTTAPLKNIWSPTHAVEIVRGGETSAKIAYEASGGSLNEDFMLLYDTDASDLGLSVVAYKPAESQRGHFALMITPRQLWPRTEYQPQDVVFVMDTSGSMAGEKIVQARRALRYCVEKLDDRDRFNVVRFSTGFDVLFPQLVSATGEHRAKAHQFADAFSASGGTNIADTLVSVMHLKPADDEPRPYVVVFVTDGQGNREAEDILQAIAAVPGARQGLRLFPFGVGHDVNTILLDRLSGTYSGWPTYVQPGENLELVLGDFFSVVSQPVLTNLRLTLPGVGVTEQFPATLGDLYHGQQLIIAGQFGTPATGPVTLAATRDGKRVEFVWPNVAFTSTPEATYVPSVWAGRKISYLIDQIRAHGESQEMIEEIVELSRTYGIQTPYSSWLVAPEGRPQLARQRPSVPAEFGSGRRAIFGDPSDGPGVGSPGTSGPRGGRRSPPGGGVGGGRFGGDIDGIDLDEAERAVGQKSGRHANLIARKNAQLRERISRDTDRLDTSQLPVRKVGGRWYHWIDGVLVDEDVNDKTHVIAVRFGSDAYFELAGGRPDLRPALAAATEVMVLVGENVAVLVLEGQGSEEFSPQQRKQTGVVTR